MAAFDAIVTLKSETETLNALDDALTSYLPATGASARLIVDGYPVEFSLNPAEVVIALSAVQSRHQGNFTASATAIGATVKPGDIIVKKGAVIGAAILG